MVGDRERFSGIFCLHNGVSFVRKGDGFSIHELRNVGLSHNQVRAIKTPTDFGQETVYETNASRLNIKAGPELGKDTDSSGPLDETE